MQARRRAQPSGTNSPSSSHPRWKAPSAMRRLLPCPPCGRQGRPGEGVPGRLEYIRAAGERPPRARPQRRGSPGPIPNPAVKPAFAESTAARGCGRAGRRARGGRFSYAGPSAFCGGRGFASGPIGVASHTAPARHRGAGRYRRGIVPCGPLRVLGHCPAARLRRPISAPGWLGRRRRMRDIRRSRCRGPARRGVPAGRSFVRALRACSVLRCMRSV